jgi:small-conductance mechanosensitive channel
MEVAFALPLAQTSAGLIQESVTEMWRSFLAALPGIGLGIIVFFIFMVIGTLVKGTVTKMAARASKDNKSSADVFGRLARLAVLLVGIVVALSVAVPSFSLAGALAALGVTGVAIGFAFKDIFQNFLAGLLLLIGRPFKLGDVVEITGFTGVAEDIDTRSLKLREFSGELIVIPNQTVFISPVKVITSRPVRRFDYTFGVEYGADMGKVEKIALDTINSFPGVLDDPEPSLLFSDLGDSAVTFSLRWWVDTEKEDAFKIKSDALRKVKENLEAAGISIPFPMRELIVKNAEGGNPIPN